MFPLLLCIEKKHSDQFPPWKELFVWTEKLACIQIYEGIFSFKMSLKSLSLCLNRDNKMCSWVPRDWDLRKAALAMPIKNGNLQTRLLVREGVCLTPRLTVCRNITMTLTLLSSIEASSFWGTQQSRCLPPSPDEGNNQFRKRGVFLYLEFRTMNKLSNSEMFCPSFHICFLSSSLPFNFSNQNGIAPQPLLLYIAENFPCMFHAVWFTKRGSGDEVKVCGLLLFTKN
jgi:hypothetical protein